MRISDWSSDVCSSDLRTRLVFGPGRAGSRPQAQTIHPTGWLARPGLACVDAMRPRQLYFSVWQAGGHSACLRFHDRVAARTQRSEEPTSELQSLMRISYAVYCLNKELHSHNHNTKPDY